jgi:hypothetical protein
LKDDDSAAVEMATGKHFKILEAMFDNFYQFKCPRKVIPLHLDYHGCCMKKDREF